MFSCCVSIVCVCQCIGVCLCLGLHLCLYQVLCRYVCWCLCVIVCASPFGSRQNSVATLLLATQMPGGRLWFARRLLGPGLVTGARGRLGLVGGALVSHGCFQRRLGFGRERLPAAHELEIGDAAQAERTDLSPIEPALPAEDVCQRLRPTNYTASGVASLHTRDDEGGTRGYLVEHCAVGLRLALRCASISCYRGHQVRPSRQGSSTSSTA